MLATVLGQSLAFDESHERAVERGMDTAAAGLGVRVRGVAKSFAGRGVLSGIATAGRNVELENFTSAMYEAREIAIERMQAEAAAAKAEGVVGVDIHEGSHNWESHVIEFFAIGTAVLPLEQEIAPAKIADPIMVLSVND